VAGVPDTSEEFLVGLKKLMKTDSSIFQLFFKKIELVIIAKPFYQSVLLIYQTVLIDFLNRYYSDFSIHGQAHRL
jgi:hypothetical protein